MDLPATVHSINVLTVVTNERYKDFVKGLQTEISETLSARPRKATEEYFIGKVMDTKDGLVEITPKLAKQVHRYLIKNDYIDIHDSITDSYHTSAQAGELADLPDDLAPYAEHVYDLIDSVFDDSKLPEIEDGRKRKTNPLNSNFYKKEFQELWSRINRKAVYRVDFESEELIDKAISAIDNQLHVTPLLYTIQIGEQAAAITDGLLKDGKSFKGTNTSTEHGGAVHSEVSYDLIGKVSEEVQLTRKTVAAILSGIKPVVFEQFRSNPEHFLAEASRLIKEQKATVIVEQLSYDEVEDKYDADIFTAAQAGQDFSRATDKLKHHVYDYCITDSAVESKFVTEIETSDEIVVYAKLPSGFLIPTPVGHYNPDWAIAFKKGSVKHIYFVAETKGSMSSMQLRQIEKTKIECAQKFFAELSDAKTKDNVKYDVVTDYEKLMDLVK